MTSGLPARAVQANIETQQFWDATARGVFLLVRCNACDTVIWYPRPHCPECGSVDVSWFEASGRGTVYSCTINRSGGGAWKAVSPYVLAYVQLEEGPRILSNIVGCDPEAVHIGMAVSVVFDDAIEDTSIYRFTPA